MGQADQALTEKYKEDLLQPNQFHQKKVLMVSTMNQDEIEGVLGHEVAHVANGDMVTLSLIQGIINAFVIFFSRVIGHFVD